METWTGEQQQSARDLLVDSAEVFSQSDLDLGKCNMIKHAIKITDVGYTKEGQNIIVYPTFYIDVLILTYLDKCPGVEIATVLEYMYVCMSCLLD